MERTVAIKRLRAILGKSFGYRINPKAPTPEERGAAKLDLPAAIQERDILKEQRERRYREILAADAEYQRLLASHNAARERVDRLSSITRHFKITVGTSNSMFFHVKAEGDSWEDVIIKLTAEKQAA